MFPQSDGVVGVLTRERQAEVRRAFERYQLVQSARAAQPARGVWPATLLGRLQRRPGKESSVGDHTG